MSRDPRIDAYVAKAQPFARPILEHVRERVHALVPGVEETMKWSHPSFGKDGKIVVQMAAFKEHMAVGFWRAKELGLDTNEDAMGQLGKLKDVDDLPRDFDALIAKAADLTANVPTPPRPKRAPKPMPDMHPEFAAALADAPKAQAAFDAISPGCRREYLEWIGEAKQDATRQKRIATTIEWVSEGKKRNWKYENC